MSKFIGVLTSGGDCPGLNAAIRGLVRAGQNQYDMQFVGFLDGFRGMAQDRTLELNRKTLSGILVDGGTILGTSRDTPARTREMTDEIVATYNRHHLDALVCLGGDGTHKNAMRLKEAGLNVVTMPKTIDNDIACTDVTFGFNTALGIATEAIDRLHSTATSHHRVMVVEIMGNSAGWLTLGAGIAGGADVILLPEIPYDVNMISAAIKRRARAGKRFSIVAVAEGAISKEDAKVVAELKKQLAATEGEQERDQLEEKIRRLEGARVGHSVKLTQEIEEITGQESRLTILGHLQRGGTPSSFDRLLATRLGTACARMIHEEKFGNMVAVKGQEIVPVAIEEVANTTNRVPVDHAWVETARLVGTSFGDQ